ncbi:MAG TPA: hypothetical protein VFR90_16765 [Methylibium sp.]|uniref:hypothetical protein n=1 Tax=Methylibium sp. TaxID=2067992 RepID=UPI002DBC2ECA|nr:hypothetical protein [Methylibium sp.]HEU4460774.1 hypothetical protein [Methylibium sp.]
MSFSSEPPYTTRQPESEQGWQSTRVQTQYSPRLDLPDGRGDSDAQDIGRAVGDGTRELFVACEPADALVQQFDHLQPEFIAVHDLGVSASHKFLAGVAAAGQRSMQKLVIRRNGAGTVLATIQFVDCPAANGQGVRLYSTEVDGDTRTRQAVARVLLGRSRLGIAMVGDLPAHGLQAALLPWREASLQPGWLCRRMLFMPLVASAALPPELARFRAATVIDVSLMPQVTKPAEVWSQLCSAWNALQRFGKPGRALESLPLLGGPAAVRAAAALDSSHGRLMAQRADALAPAGPATAVSSSGSGAFHSQPAGLAAQSGGYTTQPSGWSSQPGGHATPGVGAATMFPGAAESRPLPPAAQPGSGAGTSAIPLPPTPMPVVGVRGPLNDEPLERYLSDVSQIAGVVSVCAFDLMSGRPVGHAGARPGPEELARHGSSMFVSMMSASRGLGLGAAVPETSITLGQHHLLLRPLPAHPGMAVHIVLDKPHVTLALVQMQLRRLDEALIVAARITPSTDAPPSRR